MARILRALTERLVRLARALSLDRWPGLGRFIRLAGRAWNAWVYRDGLPVCVDHRVTLRLSPRVFSGGPYAFDPKLTDEIRRLAQPGKAFLDAGAHMGICSLLYAAIAGPETRIAAFDPNPNVFPLLVENVRASGQSVQVMPCALGERRGEVRFYVNGRDPNASLSKEAPGRYWFWKDKTKPVMKECRVSMTTIDAFCAAFAFDPGLIKLDVEGAELPVLRGGAETLRRMRPAIILETHVFAWASFGYGADDLQRFIAGQGYEVFDANDAPFCGTLGEGPLQDNNHYLLRPR